jgi:peptide/nickel transport system substrate-binding protein
MLWSGDRAPVGADGERSDAGISRREVLRRGLVGGTLVATPGLLAACGSSSGPASDPAGGSPAARASRGGRLRVGLVGNGTAETLDPNVASGEIDIARSQNLYERLVDFNPDGTLYNRLAADLSPNADATVWKVKIVEGVEFHDGSPLTAEDVAYSLKYVFDPSTKAQGATDIAFLEPKNIRALDATTVELRCSQPIAEIANSLCARSLYIFKKDATPNSLATTPNGTGPFKFQSWKRGQRSLFVRHDGYRHHDGPYLDELEFISIDDATARYTGLLGGQLDAAVQIDPSLAEKVKGQSSVQLLNIEAAAYTPQLMITTADPFTDNDVRQAFRYMVDREALVKGALSGYGKVANDLSSWPDPLYASDIAQREYDPEKAKSLLAKAGKSGLTVELATAEAAPGMLASSTLLAEQARAAGVTVKLKKAPASQYYSTLYLKAPFECTNWGYKPLEQQIAEALVSKAVYNETQWADKSFDALFAKARGTLDAGPRKEMYHELQQILWDRGGYLIWGFLNNVDAVSAKVKGIEPSVVRNLGYYNLNDVSLA